MSTAPTTTPVVLIVDDYRDACDMYAAYFEIAGFHSLKASDGYQALRLAMDMLPDVILMDLAMPGIDGYEVTRRLKDEPKTRHIPVIALTAHARGQEASDMLASGFDDLIIKPCPPDVLADELARVVRRVRGGDAPDVAA
jgi:CheY-like chemotaxis protein